MYAAAQPAYAAPPPAYPAAPPAPTAPPPMRPADAPQGGLPATAQQLVDNHNAARAKHCVPPLAWSAQLAAAAQKWANTLRDKRCAFEHSGGPYGENLAAGTTGYMDPAAVVAMWYGEIKDYDYKNPGFSMQTGHFTQVVWKTTQSVGCGMVQCNGMDVWVCEYDPPGNWDGQYKDNVPKPCK
jgi:uncharacterized protein YkwD